MKLKRPMLAGKMPPVLELRFPVVVQPKLDGLRILINKGVAYSRRLKRFPNEFLQWYVSQHADHLQGIDGEIVVGDPTAKGVCRKTMSAIMSEDGEPDFKIIAFDRWDSPATYKGRLDLLQFHKFYPKKLWLIDSIRANSVERLNIAREIFLAKGYEGVILRCPASPYKNGRSSPREQYLLKWKDFEDAEARVVGFDEQMHNANPQVVNELGLHKRSSHRANKHPKGTLGALIVKSKKFQVQFRVGSGFDDAERQHIWDNKSEFLGKLVKFKYQPYGVKDAPRNPIFLGWRDKRDA